MSTTIINVQAKVQWNYCLDPKSKQWIAACDMLGLVVSEERFEALGTAMNNALDTLFRELMAEGELDAFLKKHGWKKQGEPPKKNGRVHFDIPFNTRQVRPSELSAGVC